MALIPPDVLEVLTDRWESQVPDRQIQFYSLRDVYVTGEGLIFDQDLSLYVESITQNAPSQIEEAYRRLRVRLGEHAVPRKPGSTVLCGKAGLSNYGHWMLEILPIAYLSRPWIGPAWGVILPEVYNRVAEVVYSSLGMLGIPRHICLDMRGWPCHFEELVFVTGISQVGNFYYPVAVECMDFISRDIEAGRAERIWISRLDNAGSRRSLMEELAVCTALEARGWRILCPEGMSLVEQISALKGANQVAGVAGAGMTNIGFMRPGGRVTCFMPAAMPDIFFLHLAHHRGLHYREVRCATVQQPDSMTAADGKLLMGIDELLAALD